jgi:hypothetical protein
MSGSSGYVTAHPQYAWRMNCWWCGVEPLSVETYDIHVIESVDPVRTISHARWPEGDHTHAENAPAADELGEQAYRMLNQRVG